MREEAQSDEGMAENLAKLQTLGLTRRQAEVAFWIARGKTNDDIAIILRTSRHTIPHHVGLILERLDLATRAEVMLRALETLGWLRWPVEPRSGTHRHRPVQARPIKKTQPSKKK